MFFNHCFSMYIYYMNQSHSIHCRDNQVHTLHHFIDGVVRRLSPADHHRALTHGTVGDFMFEPVNHKGNTFVHEIVQVGGHSGHLRHHPNLSKKKKSQSQGHEKTYASKTIHLPKNGDPSYDGNGGSHFFGVYASARSPGSSVTPRLVFAGSPSSCI